MTSIDFRTVRNPSILEKGQVVPLKSQIQPITDVAGAVATALSHPLNFPPFASAMVDDDRIALAVDSTLPSLSEVVLGAVDYLLAHQASLDNISVVLSPCCDATLQAVRDNLPPHLHQKLAIFVHNPTDPGELGYLAASAEEALPIYVNRRLLDADVVLPIALYHRTDSIDYFGIAGIFPLFADAEVMKRCSTLTNLGSPVQSRKRARDAQEAAWLLGTQCIVKILPAGDGKLQQVLAGDPQSIEDALAASARSLEIDLTHFADLVISEVDGNVNEQTWTTVARALHSARTAIGPNGAIVLRTQLQQSPGPSLRRLTSLDSADKIEKQLSKESGQDTLTASLLSDYLQRVRIFMQAKLPQDAVEDLGVGYVADDHQIEKLINSSQRCLWIPAAQHYVVKCEATEKLSS